jgi:hypothetical protein
MCEQVEQERQAAVIRAEGEAEAASTDISGIGQGGGSVRGTVYIRPTLIGTRPLLGVSVSRTEINLQFYLL